jgi:hypothetical protein
MALATPSAVSCRIAPDTDLRLGGTNPASAIFEDAVDRNRIPLDAYVCGRAKRAIYLHMLGAPPQFETFDYKPGLQNMFDKDLPESIRSGQRLTTMT